MNIQPISHREHNPRPLERRND